MSKYKDICPLCGYQFDWIDDAPKVSIIENTTPNLSPSLSEPIKIECPNCKIEFDADGKEILY